MFSDSEPVVIHLWNTKQPEQPCTEYFKIPDKGVMERTTGSTLDVYVVVVQEWVKWEKKSFKNHSHCMRTMNIIWILLHGKVNEQPFFFIGGTILWRTKRRLWCPKERIFFRLALEHISRIFLVNETTVKLLKSRKYKWCITFILKKFQSNLIMPLLLKIRHNLSHFGCVACTTWPSNLQKWC